MWGQTIVFLVVYIACAWAFWHFVSYEAPEGYEDEEGFHAGPDES